MEIIEIDGVSPEEYTRRILARQFGFEGTAFAFYFWFVGWDCLSIGFHLCLSGPHVELHLPFGFIKLGWRKDRWAEPRGWLFFGRRWPWQH